jgi:quinol monooxygenase YgiN
MHNAHIVYKFKQGQLEAGVKIWEETVYKKIKSADGFIRVQLYTSDDEMMAIGTWEEKSYAEAFMKTGVFHNVMESFKALLESTPVNTNYNLRHFEERN